MTCNCAFLRHHRKDMQRIVRKKIAELKTKKDFIFGDRSMAPTRIIQEGRMDLLHEWLRNLSGDVKVKRAKVIRAKFKVAL